MDDSVHAVYRRPRRAVACAPGICAALLVGAAATLAPVQMSCAVQVQQSLIGRPVGEVLDDLRSQGLTFIYSTRLVSSQLRVESEPQARNGLALAEQILAPHGLGIRRVTPGVFAVVAGVREVERRVPKDPSGGRDTGQVEEVIVQTSRYALHSRFSVEETLLTHDDIQNLPSLGEEPLRAVQKLPGIAVNGFSSLGAVRGGEPNETAIVLDGLRLYEPFHLKNFMSPVSLLDSRSIRSMQVYSGGFPALHGERMSSIIEAQTVDVAQPRYYEAGLSLFHLNLLASAQLDDDRGRGLVAFRRSNLSELAELGERDFGKPEYRDGLAKFDYRLSDSTDLSVELLASNDRIVAIRQSQSERAHAEYRNTYLWSTLRHDWESTAQSRLILSYTDIDNERDGRVDDPGRRSGLVRDDRQFHVIGLRADHEFNSWGVEHRTGFEARRLWGRYDYEADVRLQAGFPFPDSPAHDFRRVSSPRPDGFEVGAWWSSRIMPDPRWIIEAGLRVDTQTYEAPADGEQIAPRLNVLYALNDATRVRATWGRFYQSQAINELQVEDGIDRFHGAQRADHLILGLDHALRPGLDLRIEAYRKEYKEISPRFENLFNPLVLLPEIQFDRVMIAPARARAEGVEIFLRWESQGPWRAWFGYTWSKATDMIDGREVPRSWDQTRAISAGVGWASGPWSVTVTDSYHSGWPTTTMTVVRGEDGSPYPVMGERNARRLGAYNSFDVRIARTYALSRGALDVFVEATNLFSRENQCCIEYTLGAAADGSPVLDEEMKNWLPRVPSIGVLWRY